MATLMEKDVLLEVAGSVLAFVRTKCADIEDYKNNTDRNRLLEIRDFLYNTFPHEIDFQKILTECQVIKKKYL